MATLSDSDTIGSVSESIEKCRILTLSYFSITQDQTKTVDFLKSISNDESNSRILIIPKEFGYVKYARKKKETV